MHQLRNMSGQDLAELAIDMHHSLDLTDPAAVDEFRETGFRRIADHFISVQRIPMFGWNMSQTFELGPQGVTPWVTDKHKMGMHITYGGTPHHVRHGYGFWHINDVDEFYIWTPGQNDDDFATMVIVERDRLPGETDMVAWYCQNCWNLLYCAVHQSGNSSTGWPGTAEVLVEAVNTFNQDEKLRVCSECKAQHPLAYHLIDLLETGVTTSTPEEEAARFEW